MEPKQKAFLSPDEHEQYLTLLREAQGAAGDNHVYYDLDTSENPNKTRKALKYVAEKAEVPVIIRRERGRNSLVLKFKPGVVNRSTSSRMSADECRDLILNALTKASEPMQKAEIIHQTGISPSTWNIRIKELMQEGRVQRQGQRRDTRYSLAS